MARKGLPREDVAIEVSRVQVSREVPVLREEAQTSFERILKRRREIYEQEDEDTGAELEEENLTLADMLRLFPALKGKSIQIVYSKDTDDLFDERGNTAKNQDADNGKTLSLEPKDLEDPDEEQRTYDFKTKENWLKAKMKRMQQDEEMAMATLKSEIDQVKELINELAKKRENMEYTLVKLIRKSQRRIQRDAPSSTHAAPSLGERTTKVALSMFEFTVVNDDIVQIKKDI